MEPALLPYLDPVKCASSDRFETDEAPDRCRHVPRQLKWPAKSSRPIFQRTSGSVRVKHSRRCSPVTKSLTGGREVGRTERSFPAFPRVSAARAAQRAAEGADGTRSRARHDQHAFAISCPPAPSSARFQRAREQQNNDRTAGKILPSFPPPVNALSDKWTTARKNEGRLAASQGGTFVPRIATIHEEIALGSKT